MVIQTLRLVDAPAGSAGIDGRTALPAIPPGGLVLTDDRNLIDPGDTPVWTPESGLDALTGLKFRHLRILTRLDDLARSRSLHDGCFVALRAGHDRLESVAALLVNGVTETAADTVPAPLVGLFTGLLRAAAIELTAAWCATVVTDDRPVADAVALLAAESTRYQPFGVAVHAGRRRLTLGFAETAVVPTPTPLPPLGDGAVIVAFGGGRGITAECLRELATHVRAPHIHVLGRTRPPANDSPPPPLAEYVRAGTAGGPGRNVSVLVAEHRSLVHAEQLRRSRERLPPHTYTTCDVTDADAVTEATEAILARHGGIDLLVHAAGDVASAALPNKRLSTFRRVRDVKLLGYTNLKRALADRPPRIWCNFGSWSAIVGVTGDTDYVAANAFLLTTAWYANRRQGRDEFTIAWPGWSEVGMTADPAVAAALSRHGVPAGLTPRAGRRAFVELLGMLPHPPVVVCGGDPASTDRPGRT